MKSDVSHFKVGLFVLAGLFVALGALVWVGSAHLFGSKKTYVSFFDESVRSLVPGAEIRYLGVPVGRVSWVGLTPGGRYARVVMQVRPDFEMGERLVASLRTDGLTGIAHLTLERLAEGERETVPEFDFPVEHPVVPSRPGGLQELMLSLSRISQKLETVDMQGLVTAWKETGREAEVLLSGKALQETLQSVRQASGVIRDVADSVGGSWEGEDWEGVFRDVAASAASVRSSSELLAAQLDTIPPGTLSGIATKMDRITGSGAEAVDELSRQARDSLVLLRQSIYELNRVLDNLNRLVASLREEPSEILARPPDREPFERK